MIISIKIRGIIQRYVEKAPRRFMAILAGARYISRPGIIYLFICEMNKLMLYNYKIALKCYFGKYNGAQERGGVSKSNTESTRVQRG